MLATLSVEVRKLNRSLAALLAVAAPSLIGVFCFFLMTRRAEGLPWNDYLQTGFAIWAFFMIPMSITALTALLANMEHAPKSWDHLRALPVPRWCIYVAKAICAASIVAAMSAGLLAALLAAAYLARLAKPELALTGELDLARHAQLLAMMWGAGLLMTAVQLWVALRFANFIPGIALGMGGTFFAVVASGADEGAFIPWMMPVNMLNPDPSQVELSLVLGVFGGIVLLAAMTAHLSRRDVI